jgi:CheY-like chemotaxis protein
MEIGNLRAVNPPPAGSCLTPPRYHVLYVDSNEDDRFFTEAACRHCDVPFDFRFASAAKEAVSILEPAQSGSSQLPDLILLEVRLPRAGGFSLLKHLVSQTRLSKIPLIVYTDALDPKILDRARKLGADLIIEKEPSVAIAEKLLKAATELCCKTV